MTSPYLHIVIPGLTPPSVNSYVRHGSNGSHVMTPQARAFKEAAIIFARQAADAAYAARDAEPYLDKTMQYEVMLVVFFGAKQKGDLDNLAKLPLDGLVKAGVIHSDAAIVDLVLRKRRDRENPRTEIWIRQATEWKYPPTWDRAILHKQKTEQEYETRIHDHPPKPDPAACHCGKPALTKVGKKGFCKEHAADGRKASTIESKGKTAKHASDAHDRAVTGTREKEMRGL